ncbi:MAG TPA: DUF3566 domain-containing protein [Aeromicrobium sp.]|nr:DUF3566 domain-containing protein [Aeromicrobium sp.]
MTGGAESAGPPPQGPPVDLSQQDYARTTSGTPDHTALIPAIRDDAPDSTTAAKPVAADAPGPASAPPPPAAATDVAKHAAPIQAPAATASPVGTGRSAPLRLVRVEPYSVTRLAFVVSVALMIVSVVAVAIFWIMLAFTGVWGQINDSVASLLSDDSASFDIKDYLGFGRVVGGTLVLSGINVILMTGLATVGAHLYNLAAELLGGVEATFADVE